MCTKRVGFDALTLTFSSMVVTNVLILIFGAFPYWSLKNFELSTFITGMWGSIINSIAWVTIQQANILGPLGPVAAITALYSPLLVVVEAIKSQQMISILEGFGVVFGLYGATLMAVPKFYQKICFKCIKVDD